MNPNADPRNANSGTERSWKEGTHNGTDPNAPELNETTGNNFPDDLNRKKDEPSTPFQQTKSPTSKNDYYEMY